MSRESCLRFGVTVALDSDIAYSSVWIQAGVNASTFTSADPSMNLAVAVVKPKRSVFGTAMQDCGSQAIATRVRRRCGQGFGTVRKSHWNGTKSRNPQPDRPFMLSIFNPEWRRLVRREPHRSHLRRAPRPRFGSGYSLRRASRSGSGDQHGFIPLVARHTPY